MRDAHQLAGGRPRCNTADVWQPRLCARRWDHRALGGAVRTALCAQYARRDLEGRGLAGGPVDGVYPDVSDPEGLHAAVSRTRDLGFTGVLCIHPTQIDVVHAALRPTEEELAWARQLLDVDADAVLVDGQMIDTPRWELARRLVRAAD